MENIKSILISLGIGAVVGLGLGYFAFHTSQEGGVFGGNLTASATATTTHQTAGNSEATYNWQFNVVDSLRNVRAPLAGMVSTSSLALTLPTFLQSGATSSIGSFVGLVAGDMCIASIASTPQVAQAGLVIGCQAINTTTVLLTYFANTTGTVSGIATTVEIRVLPKASFVAPAALDVTTSSAPGTE